MKEQNVLKKIMLAVCNGPRRLWRSNAGMAWTGDVFRNRGAKPVTATLAPGDMVIRNPRPFRAGFKGLSDLTGYVSVTIREADVGKKVAVFSAVEVKKPKARGATKEQAAFIDRVKLAGGFAGVARSPEEAETILKQHL